MPPSELTPNYRADNNRGAQSCAAVCSRRKSGCRIAGCHAPFCRPRIILRARCHSTLPPPCPDYRKLSTIIPPAPRVYRSNHSIRVSRDRLRRRSIYVTGNETRYPERECYWRKNSSRDELRGYFCLFVFALHALGLLLLLRGIFNGDDS